MRRYGGLSFGGFGVVAAAVLVAGTALFGTGQATADDSGRTAPKFLAVSIDSVTPGAVTLTSDPQLTVVATVSNIGDRPVDNITARIQRGPAVTGSSSLRSELTTDQQNYPIVGPFATESDRLSPGQRKQFTLTIPLRTDPNAGKLATSLHITQPGVYPLLININGKPAYGRVAHLDDARFLLPVLGVPPDPTAADPTTGQPVPPAQAPRIATTMLWPLADLPRRVPGQPGSLSDKVELADDDLATSLAKGGRLDTLVSAVETATGASADHDHRLADSICLAIDPDLLQTVAAMTKGYKVTDGSRTKDGTGAAAATAWLGRVRTLAAGMCTVAMPFAQADLTSVTAVDNDALSANAISTPTDVVNNLLSTNALRGVVWPGAGSIDDRTAAALRRFGATTAILAGNSVGDTAGNATDTHPDLMKLTGDSPLHVAVYDSSAAAALAAVGPHPSTPSTTPGKQRYDLTLDSRAARLQDALGTLAWNALEPSASRSQLLVPPQLWEPDATEAGDLLGQIATLFRSGLSAPRKLADLVNAQPDPVPVGLTYLPQAHADAPQPGLIDPIRMAAQRIEGLAEALVDNTQQGLTGARFVSPLREDLLRALDPLPRSVQPAPRMLPNILVSTATTAIDGLIGKVTVLSPGGVYTLASDSSPLLLVARNGLPVGIRVLIDIDGPADMKITDIGEQQLPPNGLRRLELPAQATSSRNMAVKFSLNTPAGQQLGQPTTVQVRSNAYGTALAVITWCGIALLVLLVGRRLWRRFRGKADPADTGLDVQTRRRLNRYGRAKRRQAELEATIPHTPILDDDDELVEQSPTNVGA